MNVRNKPLQDMACVVKRETPPECARLGRLRDHHHEQDFTSEKARFFFPHVLAASSVAGQPDRQRVKRSSQPRGLNPAQATHL